MSESTRENHVSPAIERADVPSRRTVLAGIGAAVVSSLAGGIGGRLAQAGELEQGELEKKEKEREFLRVPIRIDGQDSYDAAFGWSFEVTKKDGTIETVNLYLAKKTLAKNLQTIMGPKEAHRIAPALVGLQGIQFVSGDTSDYTMRTGFSVKDLLPGAGDHSGGTHETHRAELVRFAQAYGPEAMAALYVGDEEKVRELFKPMSVPGYFTPRIAKEWPTKEKLDKMTEEEFWAVVGLEWPEQRLDFLLNLCQKDVMGTDWIARDAGKYGGLDWYQDTEAQRKLLREFITKSPQILGVPKK